MIVLKETEVPGATARLHDLAPEELAADQEAARIVARFVRKDGQESAPIRVATFSSCI
jgi:hypothetical protein